MTLTAPVGRVLHRHHAELGAPALDLVEDLRDGLARPMSCAEEPKRRMAAWCVKVPGGPEVRDGQRVLERERGGEDLAPDGADRVAGAADPGSAPTRRSRTWASRSGTVVRQILLPLELADLEGGVYRAG